ncbi:GNAT family N-acetyltransferase [Shewanella youngdeokensis]|uniref:GNAT family N-acetyltransferase n=1 Tax=Shewanella youngdeokensis TaxID=2999068 RepID=A0ABZ0K1C2_9GAMM|nr:GNAT family N-acetyltransferase [Shewanella sp. DAU334]
MISIRKANAADAATIYTLRNRAILDNCADLYSPQQLTLWTEGELSQSFVDDIANNFYVSEINGQVIGSGKITLSTTMIDAIFVDPDYFGRGAAKLMMSFLEDIAIQHNLNCLTLDSTLNAAPFYQSCGFVGEDVSDYQSPRGVSLSCIRMHKIL